MPGMEDYDGSQAQGNVIFSDSVDWETHAGPVDVTPAIEGHVAFAKSAKQEEQFAAARVLTILSAEGLPGMNVHKCRTEIARAGGHEALLAIASAPARAENERAVTASTLLKEAACAAIANLTAQDDTRELVVAAGAIKILVSLAADHVCSTSSDEMLMYTVGALGNMACNQPEVQSAIAAAGGIEAIVALARVAEQAPADDEESETALELCSSVALRKLAIGHEANFATMKSLLSPSEVKYFLFGELDEEEGKPTG